jgi:excisionase family DNA binding protein
MSMQRHHLLTEKRQAQALNCSLRHLANLRKRRQVPYIKLGRSVRFDPAAVERALAKLSVRELA